MGANRPKRHHYIPKMLLKNFCDDEGLLYVCDKKSGKCFSTNPKNVFVKSKLYVKHYISKATESYEYEDSLSKIESNAEPAISNLIEQSRCGRNPQLDPELNNHFKKFVIALARRTPESQERVASAKDRDVFYEVSKAFADEQKYDLPTPEILYQDPRIRDLKQKIESNVNASFAAGDRPNEQKEAERFSREVGWGIARICLPKRSFIIGSHGLTFVERDGPIKGSWLPIAHDVAVQFTAFPDKGFMLVLDRNNESIINVINRATAAQSSITAGRSETLIRSLFRNFNKRPRRNE